MQESIWRKATWPLVLVSVIMVVVFAVAWFKERNRNYILTIATASKSGSYYRFARGLARVVAKHNPQIQIKVLESEGSRQNEGWLRQQKVQLAIIQSDTPISPSTQVVSFLFPEVFHLVVNKKSAIKRVSDLKEKRIALMQKGSGSYAMFWPLIQHYGLQSQDFETFNLDFEEASQKLRQGRVDALFSVIALKSSQMSQLMADSNVELVSIDQAEALKLVVPAVEKSKIPKGTYDGSIPLPDRDLPAVAVRAVLVTHKDMEQNIIYEITRILHESRNELVKEFIQSAMINQSDSVETGGFALHAGSEAYYNREQPTFLEKYAEPMGFVLSATVLLISSVWQLRIWLDSKQKNRADLYNLQIVQLIDKINTVETLEDLDAIRNELFAIFKKVIDDLDTDRISAGSFNSFTFPWEVALKTMRYRETAISRRGTETEGDR